MIAPPQLEPFLALLAQRTAVFQVKQNADSSFFNLTADIALKIFAPQTYSCNLCAITRSTFGMNNYLRDYFATLRVTFEFLHADELEAEYQFKTVEVPAIFKQDNVRVKMIIDTSATNACRTINDLK